MQSLYLFGERPSVFVDYVVDDFGDEVMAVIGHFPEIPHRQIIISEDTWWTLFDFRGKLLDWQDGHDEE
jgi:hypothetical protein